MKNSRMLEILKEAENDYRVSLESDVVMERCKNGFRDYLRMKGLSQRDQAIILNLLFIHSNKCVFDGMWWPYPSQFAGIDEQRHVLWYRYATLKIAREKLEETINMEHFSFRLRDKQKIVIAIYIAIVTLIYFIWVR